MVSLLIYESEKKYNLLSLFFGILLILYSLYLFKLLNFLIGVLLIFYSTYSITISYNGNNIKYNYNNIIFKKQKNINLKELDYIGLVDNNILILVRGNIMKKISLNYDIIDLLIEELKSNSMINFKLEN